MPVSPCFSYSCCFLFPLRKWVFLLLLLFFVVVALLLLCSYLLEFIYASLIRTKENFLYFSLLFFLLVHIVWYVSFWKGEGIEKKRKKIVYFHAYNFLFSLTIQGWLFGCEVVEHYCVEGRKKQKLEACFCFFLYCQWFFFLKIAVIFLQKASNSQKIKKGMRE